jgi:DNA repair protein RadC
VKDFIDEEEFARFILDEDDDEFLEYQIENPRAMPQEERPRERLIAGGPESLSDQELLMVLLNSGVKGRNVALVARDLIEMLDRGSAIPSVKELSRIGGLGESKACAVAAMLEFGRRKWRGGSRIKTPGDVYDLVRHYADRRQERFICISMNGAHESIAVRIVTIGLVNKTIVHPREVFADPLSDRASAVIVAHNHPSGSMSPSSEDHDITRQLCSAAEILGISFLDHVIFSESGFFSFRQQGLLEGRKTAWQPGASPYPFQNAPVEKSK